MIILWLSVPATAQETRQVVGTAGQSGQQAELSGFVKGLRENESLQGATVKLQLPAGESTTYGAVTNRYGRYSLKAPPGNYRLVVNYLGYSQKILEINLRGSGTVHVQLEPEDLSLAEVVIRTTGSDIRSKEVIAGIERLTMKDIQVLPTFLGEADVIKSLETLPGVSSAGEGSVGFNVRGGRADQNLILQDGTLLFNAQHVLGFFSAFNPDAVNDFTLYKGSVPAQYGGRSSSVLDVNLRNGNKDTLQVKGGIGLVASRLAVDGPLFSGKTTFLLAGRTSYSDWVLQQAKNVDVRNSKASFYDLNLKIGQQLGTRHKLDLNLYRSNDDFLFSDQFGFSWQNSLASLAYNFIISPDLLMTTFVSAGEFSNQLTDPEGIDAATVNNGIRYYQFKHTFLYEINKKHLINAGLETVLYRQRPAEGNPLGPDSGIAPETLEQENGNEYAFFLNDEWKINDRFSVTGGLRFSLFRNVGAHSVFNYAEGEEREIVNITDTTVYARGELIRMYSGPEPRLALRFRQNQYNTLKLGYSRMRQYVHTLTNTAAGAPTDILQLSNTYVNPALSDNYSLEFLRETRNGRAELSAALFYKSMEDLLEYKDFTQLLLNNNLEASLLNAEGRSYGLELQYKKTKGKYTGWLSYTYSRTETRVQGATLSTTLNEGKWFPANFDIPHNLSWISILKIKDRSSFSWNVTYNSGRPITSIVSSYELGEVTVPHFSERNAFRIPDYFRVDVSLTVTSEIFSRVKKPVKTSGYRSSLTFSVYNVLGRRNAFSVFFKKPEDFSLIPLPHKLTVLGNAFPSVTYNFTF